LLIVDEEQRFGVAHKERLKKCARTSTRWPSPQRNSAHLHMSLVGLRDMC